MFKCFYDIYIYIYVRVNILVRFAQFVFCTTFRSVLK